MASLWAMSGKARSGGRSKERDCDGAFLVSKRAQWCWKEAVRRERRRLRRGTGDQDGACLE